MVRPEGSALVLAALALTAPAPGAEPSSAVEVASLLAGTFASAAADPSSPGDVSAARIVSVLVPRSRLGSGGPVLYVEHAAAATPDRPFRQRFQRVEETADGGVVLRVFEPKVPLAVSGKWRDAADLALFGPGDVLERPGCAVRLRRSAGGWEGGTEGNDCPSALRGARQATTRLRLFPGRMEAWDRGFDLAGRQVWEPGEAPVVWERRSTAPPVEPPR